MERATGLEPATSSLGSLRSTNWATPACDEITLDFVAYFCQEISRFSPHFAASFAQAMLDAYDLLQYD